MIRAPILLLLLLLLCSQAQALTGRPEVVLVIIDDVSTQTIGTYGEADPNVPPAPTPTMDSLEAAGQRYLNFSSEPMCSPSRRNIWYGNNPLRHGGGRAIGTNQVLGQSMAGVLSLVSSMQHVNWQVGLVGKGHIHPFGPDAKLGTFATSIAAMGFDFVDTYLHANTDVDYPDAPGSPHAAGNHHYSWLQIDPDTGVATVNTNYTTDVITAAAVSRLQDNSDMSPLFLTVSYSAPHAPMNPPPGTTVEECEGLETYEISSSCYESAITYIDTKLLDITAELDLDTEDILIIIGENGRSLLAGSTFRCLASLGKGRATPCGVRVPMIISGVGVAAYPAGVPAIVNIADLHDTILDLAGAQQYGMDSISFRDCFANPATCAPRTIGSAVGFSPIGLPVPMYEGLDFTKYTMHFLIVGGTTLYGLNREYTDNDVLTFTDKLYDLGSPSTIDETKRYAQEEIPDAPYNAEQQIAFDAMQAEAQRLIDARWAAPPKQMIGVTMVGVAH